MHGSQETLSNLMFATESSVMKHLLTDALVGVSNPTSNLAGCPKTAASSLLFQLYERRGLTTERGEIGCKRVLSGKVFDCRFSGESFETHSAFDFRLVPGDSLPRWNFKHGNLSRPQGRSNTLLGEHIY